MRRGLAWSLIGFAVVVVLLLLLIGCSVLVGNRAKQPVKSLIVWGLWHDSEMIDPVLRKFTAQTGIKVEYKKIAAVAEYEQTILKALAERRGPDVFVIHHSWVEDKRGIMTPAPKSVIDGRAVREEFVDVVSSNLMRDGDIYALPTSVDTLALYYNKDRLGAAGVARPAMTWVDLQRDVERLTRVNRFGTIEQSAIALGTGSNINRAGDIVQALFLQSGLPIFDPQEKSVVLNNDAGIRALQFYTDFANKTKKVYTWDLAQNYSIDAFAEGKTAMMINYSYHAPTIKLKNPRLNFGVAKLPQNVDSPVVNFPNYWPWAVANTSAAPEAAWQLVRFMTNAESAAALNEKLSAPPARKDGVVQLQRDPELGVFAEQALTARSWPIVNMAATDQILVELADSVAAGTATGREALQRAQDRLNQLRKQANGLSPMF